MRDIVCLQCTETGDRNYYVEKDLKDGKKLELKKYSKRLKRHTLHKERKKK